MSRPDFFRVQEQGEISLCEGQFTDDCATVRLVTRLTVQTSVHKLLSFIFLFDLSAVYPFIENCFPISRYLCRCSTFPFSFLLLLSSSSFVSLPMLWPFGRKDSPSHCSTLCRFFFSLDRLLLPCCFALSVPVPATCYLASALLISIVRSSAVHRYTESANRENRGVVTTSLLVTNDRNRNVQPAPIGREVRMDRFSRRET